MAMSLQFPAGPGRRSRSAAQTVKLRTSRRWPRQCAHKRNLSCWACVSKLGGLEISFGGPACARSAPKLPTAPKPSINMTQVAGSGTAVEPIALMLMLSIRS